jgi:hypothetical protein
MLKGKGRGERDRKRVAVLHHLQHQPRRNRQCRDQRNVDAASDHDDRHREAENTEHRHVLQQRQHVLRRQKSGQGNREDRKQRSENREHDSLLADVPDSHPGSLLGSFAGDVRALSGAMQAATLLSGRYNPARASGV